MREAYLPTTYNNRRVGRIDLIQSNCRAKVKANLSIDVRIRQ